ncbi:MAG TPA: 4Fe-4S dicluster domain-containing protein [Gemmataceae bacterium]|nr:4Fe-4S dicluster domain-containing protein [Gemmataceae bacterium]
MRELPVLDETRCTGCGDCVAVCPVDCLAMAVAVPWLIRPGACVSCAACVAICPADALRLERRRHA